MGQHRPFGHAGGAARVLQEGQVFGDDFRLDVLHAIARMQRAAEGDSIRQVVFWYQTFDVFNDKVDQRPFGGGELIAHARQDDVLHLGFVDHFFQGMGKVRNNDNRHRPAVVQLMFKLARRVKRVNVDHNHPGTQDAKQRHRVLQQVRHHQRDAIPFLQPKSFLQISRKRPATLLKLTERHHLAHIHKRGLVCVTSYRVLK